MGEYLDSILNETEIDNLFSENNGTESEEETQNDNNNNNNKESAEVNPLDLFEGKPESVGSEEDTEEKPESDNSGSPTNIYSSIASGLKDDGFFSSLTDEDLGSIDNAEKLSELFDKEVTARFDERQKRIDEALNAGIQPNQVASYENAIKYLEDITEEAVSEESEDGEKLRRELIYYDLLNKGESEDRAKRKTDRIIESGNDIEEAKDALESNKEFYKKAYNDAVDAGKKEKEKIANENRQRIENIKKSVMEDKNLLGIYDSDEKTRKRIADNITKASYKNEETGEYMTPVQKFMRENYDEFIKITGILYTVTDGFKDFNKLVRSQVNKEVKKNVSELERKLSNVQRDGNGNLMFVNNNDTQTHYSNITLDI